MAQYVEGPYIVEDQPDGTRKVVGYANQGSNSIITKPVDPYARQNAANDAAASNYDPRKAAADAAKSEIEAQYAPQLVAAQVAKAQADAAKASADAATPASASKEENAMAQRIANLRALQGQISRVRELYKSGPGATSGFGGALDFLPTQGNRQFDAAAAGLGDIGVAAFKVPGSGTMTEGDAVRFMTANEPRASDYDTSIEEKLRTIENRLNLTLDELGQPQQGQQQRDDDPSPMAVAAQSRDRSNRDEVLFGQPPSDNVNGGFVPYGATSRTETNPQWAGVNQTVKGMIIAGLPTSQIKAFMNSKGIAGDAATGIDEAVSYYQKTGKTNFGVDVENMSVPMSGFDQFRNNAPQWQEPLTGLGLSPGTAAATALNAGGLGIPQMLAGGEGLDYLRSQNPGSAFAGDVAGVIGGTSALGAAGGAAARRLGGSALLGGGKRAALARQVGTDATYGGIYGAATEGDPLTGAATAAIGSGLGAGFGKGLQKTFEGGGDLAAQALRDRGIPLTAGQALGGLPKRLEDAATSIPLIGDIINARRGEGLEAFNRAAFADAGAPIGASVNDVGEAGIDALRPQISRAYDNATQSVDVQLDQKYAEDLAPFLAQGAGLTGDYGAGFSRLVNNRVRPALDTGQLSGANYQNMTRAMRDSRGSVKGQPFAEDYIEPVQGIEGATRSLMERQGGESVIAGLGRADAAYRNSKVLGKAVEASRNGGRSGEVGIFAPSQLNDASVANARKFGSNGATENRPFYDLATQGQAVLPSKIGDSGTPIRMIAGAGLLGTGTGGLGYAGADPSTVAAPASATAMLALLGTKKGQQLLVKGILDRPFAAKKLGGLFGRRKAQRAIGSTGAGILLAGD